MDEKEIINIYDATIETVLSGFEANKSDSIKTAYKKYLKKYYNSYSPISPDSEKYDLLIGIAINNQNSKWSKMSLDAKKRDLFYNINENKETIFYFHEDSGPFAYYDYFSYSILLHKGSYICQWSVGWDQANFFMQDDFPEKYIIKFLETINSSDISKWNGFEKSNKNIYDAGSVSLTVKFKKYNINIKMNGYAAAPPDFDEGAKFIARKYDKMLKEIGRSLEIEINEKNIYYIQWVKSIPSIYISENKKWELTESPFLIGRGNGEMAYAFRNSLAVSRKHASIIMREGRFYIIDHSSKNKTFLNGNEIPPELEIELFPGTELRFADEIFKFDSYSKNEKLYAKKLS